LIRFGQLNSLPFGMFAQATEQYLCERDAGLHPKRTFDIMHYGIRISNLQLKIMWERTLHIPPMGALLAHANSLLPGGEQHVIHLPNDEDREGIIPRSSKHLFFTAKEERLGNTGLRDLGVTEGTPFVCIHARDTGYKESDKGNPWSSLLNQDEDNHGYRNASIHNYLLAAEEMVRRGYFVIRMGAMVKEPLQTTNPMIIDYATKGRSDFMDIYLGAHCRFFHGGTSGINTIPRIFRRHVVTANIAFTSEIAYAMYPGSLFIPQKMWHRTTHRYLTFREFIETCPEGFSGATHFEDIGVEVIENTPEELLEVAVEMDERIAGTWETTDEDEKLQQRVWSLLEMPQQDRAFWPRMGAKFLSRNPELLD